MARPDLWLSPNPRPRLQFLPNPSRHAGAMEEHPAIEDLMRRVRVGNGRQRLAEASRRIDAIRARWDANEVEPAARVSCSTPVPAPPET